LIVLALLCTPALGDKTSADGELACITQCDERYVPASSIVTAEGLAQKDDCICKECGLKQYCTAFKEDEPTQSVSDTCIPNDAPLDKIDCALGCAVEEQYKNDCWCNKCGIKECCSQKSATPKNHPPTLRVVVTPDKPFVGGPTVSDNSGKDCLAVITAIGSDEDEEDEAELEYKFTASGDITGVGGGWNSDNDICLPPGGTESSYVSVLARDPKGALSNEVTVFVSLGRAEDIDEENYAPITIRGQPTNVGQVETSSLDAQKWLDKGNDLYGQGKYIEAIQAYEEVIRINPNAATAWYNKGTALVKQGKYDEAIKAYGEAIRLNPNYADAWNNKGHALGSLGKHDEAIKAYNEAIRLNPNLAKAWYNKGVALARDLGKYEEAIQCFDRAIELDPNYAMAWDNKGNALDEQGKHNEAIQAFDEAIRLDPNYAMAWSNKGIALMALSRTAEANAAFAKAKELGYNG